MAEHELPQSATDGIRQHDTNERTTDALRLSDRRQYIEDGPPYLDARQYIEDRPPYLDQACLSPHLTRHELHFDGHFDGHSRWFGVENNLCAANKRVPVPSLARANSSELAELLRTGSCPPNAPRIRHTNPSVFHPLHPRVKTPLDIAAVVDSRRDTAARQTPGYVTSQHASVKLASTLATAAGRYPVGGTALTAGETSIVQHCHPLNMSDTPTVVSKHDWVSSLAQQRRPAIDRSQSSELVNKIPSIEVLQLRLRKLNRSLKEWKDDYRHRAVRSTDYVPVTSTCLHDWELLDDDDDSEGNVVINITAELSRGRSFNHGHWQIVHSTMGRNSAVLPKWPRPDKRGKSVAALSYPRLLSGTQRSVHRHQSASPSTMATSWAAPLLPQRAASVPPNISSVPSHNVPPQSSSTKPLVLPRVCNLGLAGIPKKITRSHKTNPLPHNTTVHLPQVLSPAAIPRYLSTVQSTPRKALSGVSASASPIMRNVPGEWKREPPGDQYCSTLEPVSDLNPREASLPSTRSQLIGMSPNTAAQLHKTGSKERAVWGRVGRVDATSQQGTPQLSREGSMTSLISEDSL